MVMSRIVDWFFEKVMGDPLARFENANARPFAMQENILRRILRENADTEIGRKFGFQRIAALSGTELWKTYRKEVPPRGYDAFLPAIEKMKAGMEDILIPGRPEMFSLTPGTAAAPKFCPVGSAFARDHAAQFRIWTHHIRKHHPRVLGGKYLALSAPAETGRTEGGIPYGALAVPAAQRGSAVPDAVRALADAEERWFNTLLFAMAEEDIRAVAALNPGVLITLAQRMDRDAEQFLDHMEAGLPFGAGTGMAGAPAFAPRPARARALREICRANGALTPGMVWPDLEIILTWQGGASAFHLPHVAALWGGAAMRCPGLRAAEGTFSIPLRDNDASGVLAVGGHVMEFLPAGVGSGGQTLLAGQLEEGRLYRLIVTTSGGFYRYDMGDLVRVTGFRRRTPEVRFERRAEAVLSAAAGVVLTEDQVVGAMAVAAANGPLLNGFTVTYEAVASGGSDAVVRYVIALECTGGSDLTGGRGKKLRARLEQLRSAFDFELMKNNSGYNDGRQDGRVGFPRIVLLEEGSYERSEEQAKQVVMAVPGGGVFERMKIVAEI